MKTILEGKDNVSQLWGNPQPKEVKYRLLKYLLRIEVEDGTLLHNCVTGKMILLTHEEEKTLSYLPDRPTEIMRELIANHFLVPEDFDEFKSVQQLRKIYQSRTSDDTISHYVILPTTFCNAHCFYCYESDYPHIHMTEETADKLIDYMDKHRNGKGINIGWFGGEPLVGMARIDQISKGMRDRGITYSASMITNGYLFDEDVVKKSIDLWNLKRVQITLDGTEEVYNKVKAYATVKESPFQRVLQNIDLLSKNGILVNIRLNVDFYNKEDIRILIEDLGERYGDNKNVSVYLNMLFNDQGFEPVHHSMEEMAELTQILDDYKDRLIELKLGYDDHKIPSLQFSQCMADNPHTVEIQPDGSFCRCEHETVYDSYGNLDEGILDPDKPLKWRETIERSEKCPECCFYPFCFLLSHCMNAGVPCVEDVRQRNLERYQKGLRTVYMRSLKEEKKK